MGCLHSVPEDNPDKPQTMGSAPMASEGVGKPSSWVPNKVEKQRRRLSVAPTQVGSCLVWSNIVGGGY